MQTLSLDQAAGSLGQTISEWGFSFKTSLQPANGIPGIFVAQSIIFWSTGIKLYLHVHIERETASSLSKLTVFVVGVTMIGFCAEVFHRFVDMPSQWLAREAFAWLRR